MFGCFRDWSVARFFTRCSTTAEATVARHDVEKARSLLDARLLDCKEEEGRIEKKLMAMQTQLRVMAANIDTDNHPTILMHRIKAQVLEKNVVQVELEKMSALIGQLKRQQVVLKDAELSNSVLLTLRKVLKRVDPHVRKASSDADTVLDAILEQRGLVSDTNTVLTDELDQLGDIDEHLENIENENIEETAEMEQFFKEQAVVETNLRVDAAQTCLLRRKPASREALDERSSREKTNQQAMLI
ncbi:MAG: hypothetical protein CL504_09590 [Actinobacteria bacterium]|nr:hypothetical protein [Actinomycetota bacterium]